MPTQRVIRRYLIIAGVLQIVWGLTPTASKLVIDEIPVELYIALRWTISGAIFFTYLVAKRRWKPIRAADRGWIALLGILGYGVASFGTLYGLKLGGVANFALMASISPIISSVFSVLILKERPLKAFYFALPLSVLGLVVVILGKYKISSPDVAFLSAIVILGAYICESLVFVYSKRFRAKVDVPQYLAIAQIATATTMWILQGAVFHQTNEMTKLSLQGFSALVFVSIVSCVLCFAVLYWLLNRVDGHRLALFDGMHTISAILFGHLFFYEVLSPFMITGGVMILVAIVFGNLPS
jgi:drug/metabolite transporter (DMT)-like permease